MSCAAVAQTMTRLLRLSVTSFPLIGLHRRCSDTDSPLLQAMAIHLTAAMKSVPSRMARPSLSRPLDRARWRSPRPPSAGSNLRPAHAQRTARMAMIRTTVSGPQLSTQLKRPMCMWWVIPLWGFLHTSGTSFMAFSPSLRLASVFFMTHDPKSKGSAPLSFP